MRRVLFLLTLFIAGSLFLPNQSKVQAAEEQDVLINEIAWMGTVASTANEWLELKNTTDTEIDLTGWHLSWAGVDIELAGTVASGGYFLLERTDDDSVTEVAADQIYVGSLGNSGEMIVLKDTENNIIDRADWSSGWPAGDNSSKQTMERICPVGDGNLTNSWQNSELGGGSPKQNNFDCQGEADEGEKYEGRLCMLVSYHWHCLAGSLFIDEDNIIKVYYGDESLSYKTIRLYQGKRFAFYLAKADSGFVRAIVNNKTENIILSGRGIWFIGQ